MNLVRRGCHQPHIQPHLTRMPFRMHAAMAANVPASYDQRETGLIAKRKNQGPSSSCEGHGWSGAIESAFALAGAPLGFIPSELDLYRGGRSVERARVTLIDQELPKLEDNGAMTDDVLTFMATFGIRARAIAQTSDGRNSDVEMSTVNDSEALGDLEKDGQLIIVEPYAIDPMATDAEQQLQTCLAANIPVRVDAFVDTVFEDWTPSRAPVPVPDSSDVNGGGHATYLVGYGPGYYDLVNSWGTTWGDAGDCRVSSAWIRASWGLYPCTAKKVAA